jgi:signal transduction histidine kinase
VRWRLATVSAGLTLAILLVFGAAIGQVATQRIRADFNSEVGNAAQTLATEFHVVYTPLGAEAQEGPRLNDFVLPDDASARVLDVHGNVLRHTPNAGYLGLPKLGLHEHNDILVSTVEITNEAGAQTGFIQYGRSLEHVDSTVERLWLFIVAGVLAGTLLAILAGVAIAGRAMRPIASLTTTAREIATTRDTSRRIPEPPVDDEVGELARTLEEMLRSLDAARAERETAMQKQREFVADASHELRTPLTSVLANLELLQASLGTPDQAEDREIVDSALRSSRRMSRLVADLLLLARADAGRAAPHRPVDLSDVVTDAASELEPVAGDHEISVSAPRGLEIDGARDELHRLVLNLMENALRHTDPGTAVEASVERVNGEVVLAVEDDGPGIPPEMHEKVFERFFRGEGDRSGSSGLGLSIVRAVADSHHGRVTLEPPLDGRGARFVVRFPAPH